MMPELKEWLLKVHRDRYTQDGESKPSTEQAQVSFHDFKQAPIPLPQEDKHVIFLFCENVMDGVGDFAHLKKYYQQVKSMVGNHYIVQPVLRADFTETWDPTIWGRIPISMKRGASLPVYHQQGNKIQERVINEYKAMCAKDNIRPFVNIEDNDPEFLAYFKHAAAVFDIAYGDQGKQVSKSNSKLFHTFCLELGSNASQATSCKDGFSRGGMGLEGAYDAPTNIYGLEFDAFSNDVRTLAESLARFSSENGRLLVSKMLNHSVSHENAEHYLNTYKIMPGYPQSPWAAHNFILTGILKNMDENLLTSNCDFILPKNCFDRSELVSHIQRLCKNVEIELITPEKIESLNAPTHNEAGNKVRIFSGFFVDDHEYQHLHRMRTDIGLGSGDSTIMQVLSSPQLPFFHVKIGYIHQFIEDELIHTVQEYAKRLSGSEQSRVDKFVKYLSMQAEFASRFGMQRHDTWSYDPEEVDEINEKAIAEHIDDFVAYTKEVAQLAKDPDVLKGWQQTQTYLKGNYRYDLQSILTGNLYLNNPIPEAVIDGTKPRTLFDYVPDTYSAYFKLKQRFDDQEIDFLTTPQAIYLLDKLGQFMSDDESASMLIELGNLSGSLTDFSQRLIAFVEQIKMNEADSGTEYPIMQLNDLLYFSALELVTADKLSLPNQSLLPQSWTVLSRLKAALNKLYQLGIPESDIKGLIDMFISNIQGDEGMIQEIVSLLHDFSNHRASTDILMGLVNNVETRNRLPDELLIYIYETFDVRFDEKLISEITCQTVQEHAISELQARNSQFRPDGNFYAQLFAMACYHENAALARKFVSYPDLDFRQHLEQFDCYPIEFYANNNPEISNIVLQAIAENQCFDQIPILLHRLAADIRHTPQRNINLIQFMSSHNQPIDIEQLLLLAKAAIAKDANTKNSAFHLLELVFSHPNCIKDEDLPLMEQVNGLLETKVQQSQICPEQYHAIASKIQDLKTYKKQHNNLQKQEEDRLEEGASLYEKNQENVTLQDIANKPPKRKPLRFSSNKDSPKKEMPVKDDPKPKAKPKH